MSINRFIAAPIFVITALIVPCTASALDIAYDVTHGVERGTLAKEIEKKKRAGFRMIHVDGFATAKDPRFNAIWERKGRGGPPPRPGVPSRLKSGSVTKVELALKAPDFRAKNTDLSKKGYALLHVDGYEDRGQVLYAAVWTKKSTPRQIVRFGLTGDQFDAGFPMNTRDGYTLDSFEAFATGSGVRYNAVWTKRARTTQRLERGMTSTAFNIKTQDMFRSGFHLTHMDAYVERGVVRHAAVWTKLMSKRRTQLELDVSGRNTTHIFNNHIFTGGRPLGLSGYLKGSKARYAMAFANTAFVPSEIAAFERGIETYMKDNGLPGITLAIARDSRLVYARGFGVANRSTGEVAGPRHRFRIASVSKPITSVAAMKLARRQSDVTMYSSVFGPGSLTGMRYITGSLGPLMALIKLNHLLAHRVGEWPNDNRDPMMRDHDLRLDPLIKKVLEERPPTSTPGTTHAYSNFGYAIVQRIIALKNKEKLTYEQWVRKFVLRPCGIRNMTLTGGKRRKRMEAYSHGEDTSWNHPRMGAHGGWIARPRDLVRFALCVDKDDAVKDVVDDASVDMLKNRFPMNDGSRPQSYGLGFINRDGFTGHNVNLPGTAAYLWDETSGPFTYAIITNGTHEPDDLQDMLEDMVGRIKSWPSHDLFELK